MKINQHIFLAFLIFIVNVFCFATAAKITSAAINSPLNLTLSPVSLNINTKPGSTTKYTIKVRNNSDQKEELRLRFGTFVAGNAQNPLKLLEPPADNNFMDWLTADQNEVSINPGEWQSIELNFSPPETAALDYYYSVMFERTQIGIEAGSTNIQGAPAILVLANVDSPNAKKQLELEKFQVKKSLLEYLPQTFEVTVKNTGNVHLAPQGNIFIDGQGQKDLTVLPLNITSGQILPNGTRTYEVSWQTGFPLRINSGTINKKETKGIIIGSTLFDFSTADQFRFGKYTAHLLLVYDNGKRDVLIESAQDFWVIPWKILLAGLFITIFALSGIISTTKKMWQKIGAIFFGRKSKKISTKNEK